MLCMIVGSLPPIPLVPALLSSWHNVANVMYVDQPVGTGLSFTTSDSYANNDVQVTKVLLCFAAGCFSLVAGGWWAEAG